MLSADESISIRYVQPDRVHARIESRTRNVAGVDVQLVGVGKTMRDALVALWSILEEEALVARRKPKAHTT